MKIDMIRELGAADLKKELENRKKELFNLRFQHVTGQLENPMRMKDVKRDIAKIKTVIRENELSAVSAEKPAGDGQATA